MIKVGDIVVVPDYTASLHLPAPGGQGTVTEVNAGGYMVKLDDGQLRGPLPVDFLTVGTP